MYFFFNDTATTEIYTLSLHDALPIFSRLLPCGGRRARRWKGRAARPTPPRCARRRPARPSGSRPGPAGCAARSEEHTSELQSRQYLVCRLLLEKKNNIAILCLFFVFI